MVLLGDSVAAAALFNDVIFRAAVTLRLDVIDLRTICTGASVYANPVEPSGRGGRKIASAIVTALTGEPPISPSRVWTGEA